MSSNSLNSNSYLPNQLGSFLSLELFEEASGLLNAQLSSKYKALKTLNLYSIKKSDISNFEIKNYFFKKVANNLLYGLTDEFYVESYQIPKGIFGIRNFKFFSYPMLLTYYAIGLYILKLSEPVISHLNANQDIFSYYGSNLHFNNGGLVKNNDTLFYLNDYKKFKAKVRYYTNPKNGPKLVIKLDMQNFFEEIDIKILLDNLDSIARPEDKQLLNFNQATKQNILFFFNYIMREQKGVPQSEQNILSNFISHLYMSSFDFRVESYFHSKNLPFKYIRYVDDIYIVLDKFQGYETKLSQFIQDLEGILYSELRVRFNASKVEVYSLNSDIEYRLFLTQLKNVSIPELMLSNLEDDLERPLRSKANDLIGVLQEIKALPDTWTEFGSQITTLFKYDEGQKEKIKYAFEPDVLNLLKSHEYQIQLNYIFKDFNFSLITINTKAFLLIICSSAVSEKLLIDYLENKKIYNLQDTYILENLFLMNDGVAQNQNLKDRIIAFNSKVYFKVLEKVFYRPVDIIDSKMRLYNREFNSFNFTSKVIEQMKYRVCAEYLTNYSIALNFLLNEFQQICLELDHIAGTKDYTAIDVTNFLYKKTIDTSEIIQIENLFNRRNNNIVSHPGLYGISPWEVSESEYNFYKASVYLILGKLI